MKVFRISGFRSPKVISCFWKRPWNIPKMFTIHDTLCLILYTTWQSGTLQGFGKHLASSRLLSQPIGGVWWLSALGNLAFKSQLGLSRMCSWRPDVLVNCYTAPLNHKVITTWMEAIWPIEYLAAFCQYCSVSSIPLFFHHNATIGLFRTPCVNPIFLPKEGSNLLPPPLQ